MIIASYSKSENDPTTLDKFVSVFGKIVDLKFGKNLIDLGCSNDSEYFIVSWIFLENSLPRTYRGIYITKKIRTKIKSSRY